MRGGLDSGFDLHSSGLEESAWRGVVGVGWSEGWLTRVCFVHSFMQGGLGGSLRALRYVVELDFESAFLEGSGDDEEVCGDWPARAYEAVSRSRARQLFTLGNQPTNQPTNSLTHSLTRSRHFARVVRRHPSCRMR